MVEIISTETEDNVKRILENTTCINISVVKHQTIAFHYILQAAKNQNS